MKKSFFLFLLSGGASTLLDVALFSLLVRYLDGLSAYIISYSICILLRYLVDVKTTFAELGGKYNVRQALFYILTNVIVLVIGAVAFQIFSGYCSLTLAKILSIPVTFISGFIMMRFFVFSKGVQAT